MKKYKTNSIILVLIITSLTASALAEFFLFDKLFPQSAQASGATINAASCSLADVQTAINSASNGDTVKIPAGECTWSGKITIIKAITIMGAGTSSPLTKIIRDPNYKGTYYTGYAFFSFAPSSDAIAAMPMRLTGIYFDSFDGVSYSVTASGGYGNNSGYTISQLQIDNNVFNRGKRPVYIAGRVKGVIYKNQFINCDIGIGAGGENNNSWLRPIEAGTDDFLFIEGNTFTINSGMAFDPNEQVYLQEGAKTVTRYNTFDKTGYNPTSNTGGMWDSHGNQNEYRGLANWDFRGQPITEVYNNKFMQNNAYNLIGDDRGGSLLFFNNEAIYTKASGNIFILKEEEAWTQGGQFTQVNGSGTDNSGAQGNAFLTDTTKSWTPNQWVGYTIHNTLDGNGSYGSHGKITANTATTITVTLAHGTKNYWDNGDKYRIQPWRLTWPGEDPVNNTFFWNNTLQKVGGAKVSITDIIRNTSDEIPFIVKDRDYFMHAPQATGGKSIFPTRAGAADMYFDPNTANAYYPYTPYTCPHPLTGLTGSCDSSIAGAGGYNVQTANTTPPAAPTGLSVN